jgi:hypothetical protein
LPSGAFTSTAPPRPQAPSAIAAKSIATTDPSFLVLVFIFSLLTRERDGAADLTAVGAIGPARA